MIEIILIADHHRGHQQQLLALAESLLARLNLSTASKKVSAKKNLAKKIASRARYRMVTPFFSPSAKWPLLSPHPCYSGITRASAAKLATITHADIIISAGHRTARTALFYKKKWGAHALHLLSPNGNGRYFDLVIRPRHEWGKGRGAPPPNVMLVDGALSRWRVPPRNSRTAKKNQPKKIGLLLGGPSRLHDFDRIASQHLLAVINAITKHHRLTVAPSPRTPHWFMPLLKTVARQHRVTVLSPNDSEAYGQLLTTADALIATDDSINMMTEALLVEKPLWLLSLPLCGGWARWWFAKKIQRHQHFIANLTNRFAIDYWRNDRPENIIANLGAKKITNRARQKEIINSDAAATEVIKRFFANKY